MRPAVRDVIGSVAVMSAMSAAIAACPPFPDEMPEHPGAVITETTWGIVAPRDSRTGGPAGGWDPASHGQWSAPTAWDVIAIHAALLPTGELLHYSYPDGGSGSRARLWEPTAGKFVDVNWMDDVFCSGLSHRPDGTLYVTGGNGPVNCNAEGIPDTNAFNPFSRTWTAEEDMEAGRWYPTNVMLPDGRTLIFGGNKEFCNLNGKVELHTPGVGLEILAGMDRFLRLYPRMHLLSDGRIAHVGEEADTYTFDLVNGWQYIATSNFGMRKQGTSVLLPGEVDRILTIAGRDAGVTATCEIIDFTDETPSYSYTGSMHLARHHVDAVLLPDKTVMAIGGGLTGLYDDPVLQPEMYHPETGTWTLLPPHVHGRMYHSTSMLMPDGTVVIAGQDSGNSAYAGEIYSPAYLFRGPRPTISSAPLTAGHGQSFEIQTADAPSIGSVVLIRPGTNTHSVNFEQRLLDLDFRQSGPDTLIATVPALATLAVPGYYMLFILDEDDVPSVARMIRVTTMLAGDVDGDGTVGVGDLLQILASWGPCVDCPADLSGDDVVNIEDLLIVLGNWTG